MQAASLSAASHRPRSSVLIPGWILLVVTALGVVAMAHHPSVSTPDIAVAVKRITDLSQLSGVVHGGLMALMLVTFYCLSVFAEWRGASRPLILAGLIAYGAGVIVMLGAALVSGFVVPDVASMSPHDSPVDLQIVRQLLILCSILNQACADFGVVAMSVGIGLWSLDLMRERGMLRMIGMFGCVVGLVPVVALFAGALHLDVHGMRNVVLLDAAWNLAIAAWMIRIGR